MKRLLVMCEGPNEKKIDKLKTLFPILLYYQESPTYRGQAAMRQHILDTQGILQVKVKVSSV